MTPGLGRSSGEGKCYSLQHSGLENSMECIVHGRRVSHDSATFISLTGSQFLGSSTFSSVQFSHSVVSDSLRPHGILQARTLEWVAFPFPGDLHNPGIEPRSPTMQVDTLPFEPPGKSKNTREGSLSLLEQIFPTQEPNRGLLHYRRILYQLSYQGSQ